VPSVVSAVKSGASSPKRSVAMVGVLLVMVVVWTVRST
jgi:hypothetical protein